MSEIPMRIGLLATAAIFLGTSVATAQPAESPLPPIVFQTQPLGRVLDDIRAGANILGGDKGIKALNEGIKTLLGEKGFEGLDVGRPLVGYVVLAPKPEDITAVVAFPVTGEKEFLDLCDRANVDKLRQDAKDKTLYHMPPLNPRYKAVMRFQDRYAYIAYGFNPMPHLEPKALVPMAKLYDPAERGLVAAHPLRSHSARGQARGPGTDGGSEEESLRRRRTPRLRHWESGIGHAQTGAGRDRETRGALWEARGRRDTITARLLIDQLHGQPRRRGDADREARYGTREDHRGIQTDHEQVRRAHAAPGHRRRVPVSRAAPRRGTPKRSRGLALEAGRGEVQKLAKDDDKPLLEELFKGLIRTVKTGEFDVVGAVRGPDKTGFYTALRDRV